MKRDFPTLWGLCMYTGWKQQKCKSGAGDYCAFTVCEHAEGGIDSQVC